jgi:FkbM family methyltransferase
VSTEVPQSDASLTQRAKKAASNYIARNRRSLSVKLLNKFSGFVHHAYQNVGLDMETNGESHLIKRMSEARPKVAFDVGANCGDWIVEALEAWPECHFHAFEVAPETFRQLDDRIQKLNRGNRVSLNCAGLSNVEATKQMNFYPDHPNLTTVLQGVNEEYVSTPFDASLVIGDKYVMENRIDKIDFLKIDVEGMEYQVLQGLKSCLSESKVHCLQFEYSPFSIETKFLLADFYRLLSENYWLGKVFPNYVEFREYEWPMENFEFSNYCAVSKAKPALREMLS